RAVSKDARVLTRMRVAAGNSLLRQRRMSSTSLSSSSRTRIRKASFIGMLVSATGNPFLLPRRRGIMSVRTNKSKPDKSDNKARDTLLQGLRGHVPERGAGKPRQPQPGRFALRNAGILPATSGGILAASVGSIVKVDALKTLL